MEELEFSMKKPFYKWWWAWVFVWLIWSVYGMYEGKGMDLIIESGIILLFAVGAIQLFLRPYNTRKKWK